MSNDIALPWVEAINTHIEAKTKRGKELMQRVDFNAMRKLGIEVD